MNERQKWALRAALVSAYWNVDDINDGLRDDDVPGPMIRIQAGDGAEDYIVPEFTPEDFKGLFELLLPGEEW